MHFSIAALIVGFFTCKSLGGTLQVIDDNRECKIYSNENHGCTGYSAPFAKLDGDDCSSIFNVKLIIARNPRLSFVDVGACGQLNGKSTAWIEVGRTGEVTFSNQNGDKAKCQLDNGLKTGSLCTAVDTDTLTSASTTTQTESNSSTSTTSSTPTTSSSSSSSSSSSTTNTTESAASTCACN
ncbi:uncharacterized protein N7469_004605 [Penicillium citrinum]|uniref:Secreted protein n=1 Tax=Penicillium citrinum TaxID=5077 RepID=A0A9W9P7F4_PENCI|nr:uncharacterized protein N7469_004605 [Penicillium citrinum]KAJ5235437.1 hypothetical protein N7469_004605 [Penicillium citrinum]